MSRAGRPGGPAELSVAQRKTLFDALGTPGMSRDLAAQLAGIGARTLYRWLSIGKRAARSRRSAKTTEVYRQFWHEIQRVEAEAEAEALRLIHAAAKPRVARKVTSGEKDGKAFKTVTVEEFEGDWRAAAWVLERRKPKKYAPKNKLTHEIDAKGPVVFELDTGGKPTRATDPLPSAQQSPKPIKDSHAGNE